jgi:hypothetical protein
LGSFSLVFRFRYSSERGPRGKAFGRSRWALASMATLPTPFAAYSNGPDLTELLQLYACGLQPCPSVQPSSSKLSAMIMNIPRRWCSRASISAQPTGLASMATLPTPFTAYSNGPGLTELLQLYACDLQPRPSVRTSSSRVIAQAGIHSFVCSISLRPHDGLGPSQHLGLRKLISPPFRDGARALILRR